MLVVKLSTYPSLILISQLNKKDPKIIATPFIPILKTANSSENLLTSMDVPGKDEVVGGNAAGEAI